MKKLFVACVLVLAAGVAGAQKIYFIYIQSESKTPFFVKLGDKVTSATPSGYVLLPKLVDSVYALTIGKTGDATSESRFSITLGKRDRGFLLREANGKFSLFDLQELTLLQPLASANSSKEIIAKRTDAFSVLLAQAANDPSLLEVRTAVADTKKPAPAPAVTITTNEPAKETRQPQTDTDNGATTSVAITSPIEKKEPQKEAPAADTVATAPQPIDERLQPPVVTEAKPYKPSQVIRKAESSTSEGFGLVFLDKSEDATDTIRIVIPNQNLAFRREESGNGDLKKFLNISSVDSTKAPAGPTPNDAATTATKDPADSLTRQSSRERPQPDLTKEKTYIVPAKKQNACAEAAGEKDFFRLRKAMAAEESEEAMLKVAQKTFKHTCFSTAQIKNLSALFLTASGKYHFFDAAYGHVSDGDAYAALQTELDDAYYVNRFKALIANQ